MNLDSMLQKGYSKELADKIVHWVGDNQKHFDQLLEIFLTGKDYRMVQRAAWPLSYAAVNAPQLISRHYERIVEQLDVPGKAPAVRRNILRIFDQLPEIPEAYHGVLMDRCFQYIADPNEAIASQAYALGILERLARFYPEITPELKAVVEGRMPHAAPAYKARGRRILGKK